MTRLFIENKGLQIGQELVLSRENSHYVKTVLRMKEGDTLEVFNGEGGAYLASILHMSAKTITLSLNTLLEMEAPSRLLLTLVQALPRSDKMDMIIQKAVELGVNRIVPIIASRCQGRLNAEREQKRGEHWLAVARNACQQSGRNFVPEIANTEPLNTWLQTLPPKNEREARLIMTIPNDAPLAHPSPLDPDQSYQAITILVGPEGGFTASECTLAEQAGYDPWNLGRRILRTETASLAALSVLQWAYGDWQTLAVPSN